MLIVFATAVN